MATEPEVKEKLDTLAEWQSRRDLLELDKRALLENIKIPDEIRLALAEIDRQRSDIEAEFAGKVDVIDENIKKLTDEIKTDVKTMGVSVKADHFHAVYVRGRITWNTDKMEAWLVDHSFLREARKEGEPSVTLRKI